MSTLGNLKLNKRLGFFCFLVVGIIMLPILLYAVLSGEFDHLWSSNRDGRNPNDLSIDSITNEDIVSNSYGYISFMSSSQKHGEQSGIEGVHRKVDRTTVKESAKKANGISTLMATRIESGTLHLDINSKLIDGKMIIVVIKNDTVIDVVDIGEAHLQYEVSDESTFLIKFACEEAQFEISATRQIISG